MKLFKTLSILIVSVMLTIGPGACSGGQNSSTSTSAVPSENYGTNDDDAQSPQTMVDEASASPQASEQVNENEKIIVIDFFATWCGPCKALAPIMEKMEQKYGNRFNFKRIDVDEEPALAEQYQVSSIPTLVFINQEGEVLQQVVGLQDETTLNGIFSSLSSQE